MRLFSAWILCGLPVLFQCPQRQESIFVGIDPLLTGPCHVYEALTAAVYREMLPILQSNTFTVSIHHLLSTKSTAWSFAFILSNSLPCFIFISIHLLHFPKSQVLPFFFDCTCCFFDPIRIIFRYIMKNALLSMIFP